MLRLKTIFLKITVIGKESTSHREGLLLFSLWLMCLFVVFAVEASFPFPVRGERSGRVVSMTREYGLKGNSYQSGTSLLLRSLFFLCDIMPPQLHERKPRDLDNGSSSSRVLSSPQGLGFPLGR